MDRSRRTRWATSGFDCCRADAAVLGRSFVENELRKDIQVAEQGVARHPAEATWQGMLGTRYLEAGRVRGGTVHLREAIRLAPRDAEAHNNLGQALKAQGRLADAIGEFREAARLAPTNKQSVSISPMRCRIEAIWKKRSAPAYGARAEPQRGREPRRPWRRPRGPRRVGRPCRRRVPACAGHQTGLRRRREEPEHGAEAATRAAITTLRLAGRHGLKANAFRKFGGHVVRRSGSAAALRSRASAEDVASASSVAGRPADNCATGVWP